MKIKKHYLEVIKTVAFCFMVLIFLMGLLSLIPQAVFDYIDGWGGWQDVRYFFLGSAFTVGISTIVIIGIFATMSGRDEAFWRLYRLARLATQQWNGSQEKQWHLLKEIKMVCDEIDPEDRGKTK